MEQYFKIKEENPDCLLFFQVGDFYELFFDDAKIAAQILAITLTKRGKCQGEDIPLCGVPRSSLQFHLTKLVNQGFKVAICDQTSLPIPGQVVEREVTRVFTPGTLTDDVMLDEKSASYLCSCWPEGEFWGLAFIELLASKVFFTKVPCHQVNLVFNELSRFSPSEIILPKLKNFNHLKNGFNQFGYPVNFSTPLGFEIKDKFNVENFYSNNNQALQSYFDNELNQKLVEKIFSNDSINGSFGLLTSYLHRYHKNVLPQVEDVCLYNPSDFLVLEQSSIKNLDIVKNSFDGSKNGTLFNAIDQTKTNMGARLLKRSLLFPLVEKEEIEFRWSAVDQVKNKVSNIYQLENLLSEIPDLERIVGRIALDKATISDFIGLKIGLNQVLKIKSFIFSLDENEILNSKLNQIKDFSALIFLLESSINTDFLKNEKIKYGFSKQLDQLREFSDQGHQKIIDLENKEIEKTKINNLKIRYTDIHGYFIEISKSSLKDLPQDYRLTQSLVNRSRFVTQELLELQQKIFKAKQDVVKLEEEIFAQVSGQVKTYLSSLRKTAEIISWLDMIFSFAKQAYNFNYVKPEIKNEKYLKIEQGRHPVIEQKLQSNFVPNSLNLDKEKYIKIITGPNMGGKSTYLRQVAQNIILAQAGSFVPANSFEFSLVDKIFTRIGSGDNLYSGKSTFLVEMEETAKICNQATKNSLVILDEIGRGTSTYDGMAIAQAVIEFICKQESFCLFATHYHEITQIAEKNSKIKSFFMDSYQSDDDIIFTHIIKEGAACNSFGIQVAKLAGIPENIIARAKEILKEISQKKAVVIKNKNTQKSNLTKEENFLEKEILNLDLDDTSFKQAHKLLCAFQDKLKKNN